MSESERDPEVARRYRELEREEPPPALDAGIRAAARRETESRPAPLVAPPARRRWYVPLAAAAVIVLSVAVTLNLQRAEPDPELGLPDNPPPRVEPAPVPKASAAPPMIDATRDVPAEPAVAPRRAREKRAASVTQAVPAAPDRSTAVAPSAPVESTGAERELARGSKLESAAKPADLESSPEAWLAHIVELRREGRHPQADESYAAFRRRYPEYRIPESIRDRVLPR